MWIVFKREFFLIKNFKNFFFFKVLFFEKKITKFQTWKKNFFWIFSKGFTAEKISRILIFEKFSIFSPKFKTLPKFIKMIWCSDPISIPLSLKTPKNTFSTKFDKIGHFRPNYRLLLFFHFFSSFSTNVDCGFTEMWMGVVTPKNGNFERLSPV